MILEQDAALLLQRRLDDAGEHAEHARKKDLQPDLAGLDVDRGGDLLSHRLYVEIQLVARPARLDLSASGNMLLKLVDVVRDAPPGLVFPETVRKVDFDRL